MQAYKNAVERAVEEMLFLILSGYEFPDAAFRAASKYNIEQHHVEEAYDKLTA